MKHGPARKQGRREPVATRLTRNHGISRSLRRASEVRAMIFEQFSSARLVMPPAPELHWPEPPTTRSLDLPNP